MACPDARSIPETAGHDDRPLQSSVGDRQFGRSGANADAVESWPRYWARSRIARRSRRRNARWHSCSSLCPTNQCATRIDVPAGRTRNKTWTLSVCAFAIGRRRYPECCWHARLTRALPGILVLPFGHVAGPHGRRLLCHRTRKAFLNGSTSCLTPRMMALKAPYLSRRADCDRVVTNAVGPLWCRLRRFLKMLLNFL